MRNITCTYRTMNRSTLQGILWEGIPPRLRARVWLKATERELTVSYGTYLVFDRRISYEHEIIIVVEEFQELLAKAKQIKQDMTVQKGNEHGLF